MRTLALSFTMLVALAGPPACSMGSMQMDGAATDEHARATTSLRQRADAHLARIQAATDKKAVDAEIDSYLGDVGPLFFTMTRSCASMMRAESGRDAQGAANFMMDAVRGYAAAAHVAPDLPSVVSLARDHHEKVEALVRHMDGMMSSMGMM